MLKLSIGDAQPLFEMFGHFNRTLPRLVEGAFRHPAAAPAALARI